MTNVLHIYAKADTYNYILVQSNNLFCKIMHRCNLFFIKAYKKAMIEAQVWRHW